MSDRPDIIEELGAEMRSAYRKFGPQTDLPDGTGGTELTAQAGSARLVCEISAAMGVVTWRHILDEEVAEAFAETDPVRLRAELIQVAAVALRWVAAIDERRQP